MFRQVPVTNSSAAFVKRFIFLRKQSQNQYHNSSDAPVPSVRQVQLHQQMLEREAEAQRDRRRKKERLRKQQRQNQRTNEKTQINYSSPIKNKQKDDELEF